MEKYFFIIGNRLKPISAWLLATCLIAFITSLVLSANDAPIKMGFSISLIMLWSAVLCGISYFYSGSRNESIAERQGPMMRKYLGFMTTMFSVVLVILTVRVLVALLR